SVVLVGCMLDLICDLPPAVGPDSSWRARETETGSPAEPTADPTDSTGVAQSQNAIGRPLSDRPQLLTELSLTNVSQRARTSNLRLRRPTLYPIELRKLKAPHSIAPLPLWQVRHPAKPHPHTATPICFLPRERPPRQPAQIPPSTRLEPV